MIPIFRSNEPQAKRYLTRAPIEPASLPDPVKERLIRAFGQALDAEEAVHRIIEEVKRGGDAALLRLTELLDGCRPAHLRVEPAALEAAWRELDPAARQAMELAAARIRRFHSRQQAHSWLVWEGGGALGQLIQPIESVGVYVPGGRAPLVSTVLMTAIPAQVAGVKRLCLCSPPQRPTGQPHTAILAAAHMLGVQEVYAVGGAQAIAAMAFGTQSLPRVDKIVGPGNLFVILAKKQLYGQVGIDGLPGPTETVVIADDAASPALVAADLAAQAEHDPLAKPLLLTTSESLAQAVNKELEQELGMGSLSAAAAECLQRQAAAILCQDLQEALALANEFAPEHLCLSVRDPWPLLPFVRHAGGVFLGEHMCESLGDYIAGPSHVMPTGGTARFSSPLSVWDFVKICSVFALGPEEARSLGSAAATLAALEGLQAHRRAILLRAGG